MSKDLDKYTEIKPCRCGYLGPDAAEHPCHWGGYTCKKPGSLRFYSLDLVSLAGAQMKVPVFDTYACKEHWTEFLNLLRNRT